MARCRPARSVRRHAATRRRSGTGAGRQRSHASRARRGLPARGGCGQSAFPARQSSPACRRPRCSSRSVMRSGGNSPSAISGHSTRQMPPCSASSKPSSSSSLGSTETIEVEMRDGNAQRRRICTSVKVGLGTSSASSSATARIRARASVDLPAPRSPESARQSPGLQRQRQILAQTRGRRLVGEKDAQCRCPAVILPRRSEAAARTGMLQVTVVPRPGRLSIDTCRHAG